MLSILSSYEITSHDQLDARRHADAIPELMFNVE